MNPGPPSPPRLPEVAQGWGLVEPREWLLGSGVEAVEEILERL